MRWRCLGFRRFFAESEAEHASHAVKEGYFRDYLGYAVTFGMARSWMETVPGALEPADRATVEYLEKMFSKRELS